MFKLLVRLFTTKKKYFYYKMIVNNYYGLCGASRFYTKKKRNTGSFSYMCDHMDTQDMKSAGWSRISESEFNSNKE